MNQREYKLMQIIQKVEVFRGLEVAEFQRLLAICKPVSFDPQTQIYGAGQPSEDMLILLSGKLTVLSRSGEQLGVIDAGSSMGEMGMFTGEPRSATVVSGEKSNGMLLAKDALAQLMKQDAQIRGKILENMVEILSERVIDANKKIEQLSRRVHQLESQVGVGADPGGVDGDDDDDVAVEADEDVSVEESTEEESAGEESDALDVEDPGEEDDGN